MAIQIEEEKKPINIIGLLMGLTVGLALFLGVYFFLFKRPEIIDVVLPKNLKDLNEISNVTFQPENVLQSEKLKALRNYGGEASLPAMGRGNPFLP